MYYTDQVIRVTCTFATSTGTPSDPTNITAKIEEPDGTLTTYVYAIDDELVREDIGVYYIEHTIEQAGTHRVKFIGTGSVVAANVTTFFVEDDNL